MSGRRTVTIVLGVTAAAGWLAFSLRGFFHPQRAGPQLFPIALDTPAPPSEVNDAAGEPPREPDTHAREPDSAAEQAPATFNESVDTSAPWGRGFEECKATKRVATSVCKHRFEPRDPNWAPEVEQRIRHRITRRSRSVTVVRAIVLVENCFRGPPLSDVVRPVTAVRYPIAFDVGRSISAMRTGPTWRKQSVREPKTATNVRLKTSQRSRATSTSSG